MASEYHADNSFTIRPLKHDDVSEMVAEYQRIGWPNSAARYERYLKNQETGIQDVLVARIKGKFTGYLTVKWHSAYVPFSSEGIPEINDFSVLPELRRQGVGSRLMDAAEELIQQRSCIAGIGVGMTPDYGNAQRMYCKRGYVPDGRGLMSNNQPVAYGKQVVVNDDLALYFTRNLLDN